MLISLNVKRFGIEATITNHLGEVIGINSVFSCSDLLSAACRAIVGLRDYADLSNVQTIRLFGDALEDMNWCGILNPDIARQLEMPGVLVVGYN